MFSESNRFDSGYAKDIMPRTFQQTQFISTAYNSVASVELFLCFITTFCAYNRPVSGSHAQSRYRCSPSFCCAWNDRYLLLIIITIVMEIIVSAAVAGFVTVVIAVV